jgi:rRNA-processing protein FCF1
MQNNTITMKFLLDANFLMIPGKFKVDIFTELERFGKPELYTLDSVVKELEKLTSSKGKDARYAKLALTLIKEKKIKILPTKNQDTDREIERVASEQGLAVCTQDIKLKNSLLEKKATVITLRQKKYLVIEK